MRHFLEWKPNAVLTPLPNTVLTPLSFFVKIMVFGFGKKFKKNSPKKATSYYLSFCVSNRKKHVFLFKKSQINPSSIAKKSQFW